MAEVTGRPVDIEIVPRAHALLSASSGERWITCTPSARIEEALPDQPSSFASDGTAAHAFAELRLRYKIGETTKAEYTAAFNATKMLHAEDIEDWTHYDWDAILDYVEYVLAEAKRLDAKVYVEARVDYSTFAQGGFGTSDALLVSETTKTLKSIDLKFGKGVPVYAENNVQARLYALGGLLAFDPDHKMENVEWTIHQPRLDYVGEDSCTVEELLDWAKNVVAPAAEKAWKGEGELVPSEKGCRFCKAAATCRARVAENVLIARRDFMDLSAEGAVDPRLEERLMTMEEVADILPLIDGWMQWANTLKAYALEAVRDKGLAIPGYKLVRGRSGRAWKPDVDVVAALKALGIPEDSIFDAPKPKSAPQVEKAVGKKTFAETIEPALVVKPLGTPALVPVTDPRPAMDRLAEAAADFAVDKKV